MLFFTSFINVIKKKRPHEGPLYYNPTTGREEVERSLSVLQLEEIYTVPSSVFLKLVIQELSKLLPGS